MSSEFEIYRREAHRFFPDDMDEESPTSKWQSAFDWYTGGGREQFGVAFSRETGLKTWASADENDLVAAAIPKSYGDEDKKIVNDTYYRAHATWFLKEMDRIVEAVPRKDAHAGLESAYGDVMAFLQKLVVDSVILFENWGRYRMKVPGAFGMYKDPFDHVMAFYQGAKQTIYGSGSWKLSYSSNHSDLAIATIRQAIELRLRRGFGVLGKTRTEDDSIHPIPLSDLLDAIDFYKDKVNFSISFDNIKRINGWCNMYLHAGIKSYSWCPPRVLKFLEKFLLGGSAPGWHSTMDGGIILPRLVFDSIRNHVLQKHTGNGFTLPFVRLENCAVVIADP